MTHIKRLLSLVLVLALTFGLLPANAMAAETSGASVDSNNAALQGGNGFGNLLVDNINKKQETEDETSGMFEAGYSVSGLEISGNVATVTYETQKTANLVVAIYTEDALQLITSGNTVVQPEDTTAVVTIAGTMPQFFMAAAYLVDTYDMAPLCAAYDTPMYTQDMQELLASTVEDYDQDRVMNMDDDNTTNFAVFAESTKVIGYVEGVNTVVSADDTTATYVIENADSQFTGLQVGDVVAYPYGDNDILIVKVASIRVSGTTVTLTGADLDIEEVFEAIKIETTSSPDYVSKDACTPGEGVVLEDVGSEAVPQKGPVDFAIIFSFLIDKGYTNPDGLRIEAEASVKMKLTIHFDYYLTLRRQFVEFTIDTDLSLNMAISVKIEFEIPLGILPIPILPGIVDVVLEPALVIEMSAGFEMKVAVSKKIGFKFDSKANDKFTFINTKPTFSFSFDFSGSVTIAVDLSPEVWVCGGVLQFGMGLPIGVEIEATEESILSQMDNFDALHGCMTCFAIESSVVVGISLKMTALWVIEEKFDIAKVKIPLGSWYYSIDNKEFGTGSCPNMYYRVMVEAVDHNNQPIPYVQVTDSDGGSWGQTNEYGCVSEYIHTDPITIYATIGGVTVQNTVSIDGEAQKVTIQFPEDASGTITQEVAQKNFADLMDKVDPSVKEQFRNDGVVWLSGTCGADGDNVVWALYSGGHLQLGGQGAMADYTYDSAEEKVNTPWYAYRNMITRVTIGDGITHIGKNAFRKCPYFTVASIPDSVNSIGFSAFRGCSLLTNVTLPKGLTSIDTYVFYDCSSLTSISLPDGVNSVGSYAFYNCSNLTSISLPDSVNSIGSYAFYNCSSLTSASMPSSASDIGKFAFYGCKNLTSFKVPEGVSKIDESVFQGCRSLRSVILPDSVTVIGKNAFQGCVWLTNVTLPSGMTGIGESAFQDCASLGSLTIPDSVTSIGSQAFLQSYLTVTVGGGNTYYSTDDQGILYNKAKTRVIYAPTGLTVVTIPSGVTSIDSYAFYGCRYLTSLKLPSGVTSVGTYAFGCCYNLTTVTLPSTLTDIGNYAFYYCDSLTKVSIPSGVTYISVGAFSFCANLESVSLPSGLGGIGSNAFAYCENLKSISGVGNLSWIGSGAFRSCTSLTSFYFSPFLEEIGDYAFEDCFGLTSVTFYGHPPEIVYTVIKGAPVFRNVTATAYYYDNLSYDVWTTDDMASLGGNLTWVPIGSQTRSLAGKQTRGIFSGDYETEVKDNYTLKTAIFTDLIPGMEYTFLSLVSISVDDVLEADNLLYIKQVVAAGDGTLEIAYVQRINKDPSYVLLCGGPKMDLSDATITFPEMNASKDAQTVKPTVEYNGEILIEGEDYTISGAVDYAAAGQYTCYIKGIYDYTGNVECTYTVNGEMLQELGFKSASLTLQNNLAINFNVDKALFDQVGYSNPYVEFRMGERSVKVTDFTVVGDRYVFRFGGITPNQMNDTISATLYAEYGQRIYFSQLRQYSVATYCYNLLERCSDGAYAKLRTLLVDLLNYGAASQMYSSHGTESLANSRLTDAQKQWATTADPVLGSVQDVAYATVNNPSVTWKSATLSLQDSVVVRVRFLTESSSGLSLKIKTDYAEWNIPSSRFTCSDGVYTFDFDGLCAGQMRDSLYLTFYKNGVPVSNTLRYSVETYAYKHQNATERNLGELMKAMMKYGDSAYAYVMYLNAGQ